MAQPKYEARNVTQGRRAPRQPNIRAKKGLAPPSDTRAVITSLGGGTNGGVQVVHWCPREGTEWTCPEKNCGLQFVRDEEGTPWRQR